MKSLIMLKKVCPIIFFLLLVQTGFTHNKGSYKRSIDKLESSSSTPFIFETSNYWIDSLIKTLSIEERIGQLMMISAYASKDENHIQQIGEIVEKYNIGGVIYMKGSPAKQVQYTNYLQEKAKIPLLISIDGEWGLSMRLDSVLPFPRQMMLGAIENEGLIYDMGAEIAEQCKRIGIHINFAPVADINNNPKNPVINSRSFGENKNIVLRRSYAYMAGMQDNGILVTAKHFPGHGDTDVDSHYGLPSVGHNKKHLEQFELYPFRHLINMGLSGMMIAHLHVPALDSANLIPATLSKPIITDLLIKKYGFQGLIFTDAMNMGGVTKTYEPDEASLMAFKAGNDIILFSPDIKKSIQRIAQAIKDGEISEEELNYKCRKVLAAKHYMQLDQYRPIKEENIIQDLNSKKSEYLNHAIAAEAITLLENKDDIIPIKSVSEKTLLINIKKPVNDTFTKRIKTYAQIDTIEISKTGSAIENSFYIQTASNYKTTIVAWHGLSQYPSKQYGVEPEMVQFMNALSQETNVILVIFGNPYILTYPINYNQLAGLLVAYEDNHYTREYSAQLIFGGIEAKGKLPVSTGQYKQGDGLKNTKTRLGYIHPGMIKADQRTLDSIDTLMGQVIREKMTPGAQILCAKDGYVFYNKSFGYQTYDSLIPINDETIYDLASLTKILVTTPLLMNLYENDKIDLNNPLGYYIPLQPDKVDLKMIDMLSHQARFKPWFPFYKIALDDSLHYKPNFFSSIAKDRFVIPIATNLFTTPEMADSIFQILDTLPLYDKKEYLYSDMPYYYFMQLIESMQGLEIDELADSIFYKPLGISDLKYHPLRYFDINRIPPTENDTIFRKQIIHGYVHDQGAALLGGKCGHAGLFGNTLEISKIGQMLLNNGTYGNVKYFNKSTIEYFTTAHFRNKDNRRGLGFDKPEPRKKYIGPTFDNISLSSYGHTGFTGTYIWIDPEENILFVFLSNRTYPDASNSKLSKNDIRTRIHKLFYNAFDLQISRYSIK